MKKDKSLQINILVKLLKVISGDEWNEFEKFVRSSYFNEGRKYAPLLKVLKPYHPSYDSEQFTKENIYKN